MSFTNPAGGLPGDKDRPPWLRDSAAARRFLEQQRWPRGMQCPHCRAKGVFWSLAAGGGLRAGVWKCASCRRQFTVTVGTILAGCRLPLHLWLGAIHCLCEARTGVSTRELEQTLGVSYRSAWRLLQGIRYAVKWKPLRRALRAGQGHGRKEEPGPVSLRPLEFDQAVTWLLAVPPPEPLELPDHWALDD